MFTYFMFILGLVALSQRYKTTINTRIIIEIVVVASLWAIALTLIISSIFGYFFLDKAIGIYAMIGDMCGF